MYSLDYDYMGFSRYIRKIEGQTYQNLSNNIKYKGSGSWMNVYNISENGTYTFKSDNKSAYITLYDEKAIKLMKENSVYTLIFDIDTDFVNYKGICINGNTDGFFDQSTNIYLRDNNTTLKNGSYKFKFTMGSVTNMFAIGFRTTKTITGGTYFRAYNFKLLEGDYTNTDLPPYITGIESVAEREENILKLKVNESITNINLPQPLRSLPNGVCDTIEGNKIIKRIGKYTITGTETYGLRFKNDYMFVVQFDNILTESAFGDYNNSNTKMICDKALCRDCSNTTFVSNSLTIGGRAPSSKGFIIAISKSLLTENTIDKAKEYIKSLGGMTVYYELATPIEQTIDISIKKIRKNTKCYNNIKPNII